MAGEADEEEKNAKKMTVFITVPKPTRYQYSYGPPMDLKVVALGVSSDDTVASVKARLHDMEGIPPHCQRLEFPCSALPDDDDTTLGDHGVADSAAIQLVETNIQVYVHCLHRPDGPATITMAGVESSDTVESFRLRLQEREGVWLRPTQQRLMRCSKEMSDGHMLAHYGIRDYATIELHRRRARMRHREVELDIEVTDTVGRIKERVQEAAGVPVACQSVYYCHKELDDGHAVALDGRALQWVNIVCERHEEGHATKTSNKGDVMPMVITNTLKRHAGVEAAGTGKKIKKKKIRKKPLAEAETAKIPDVRRRRLSVFLIGPQLAAICPSSCDTDPAS
jgi:hypothetical protein